MSLEAVLFDLDDTLVYDMGGYRDAAIKAWSEIVGAEIDHDEMVTELRRISRKHWSDSPVNAYCRTMGLFPLACLVSAHGGESEAMTSLRQWAEGYRRTVWGKVLSRMGQKKSHAAAMGDAFAAFTLSGGRATDGAVEALVALSGRYRLGLVTNGASDLQAAKLASAGLAGYFQSVAISSVVGVAKPDARIFAHVTAALGVDARDSVVIGDNKANDIEGALAAGMRAVWLQPDMGRWPEAPHGAEVIATLADLLPAIEKLEA